MADVIKAATARRNVRTPSAAVVEMNRRRDLPRDLLGGTIQMRGLGRKWLPKAELEEEEDYAARVLRSVLFNGFGDTVERKLPTKPFSKALTIDERESVPKDLDPIFDNADGSGSSLHEVARAAFVDAATFGLSHFLVDLPKEKAATLHAQRTSGIRPKILNVYADAILGWKEKNTPAGKVLTQVRILETITEDGEDEFSTDCREVVLVLDEPAGAIYGPGGEVVSAESEGRWRRFREEAKSDGTREWALFDEGTYSAPRIPLLTFYTHKTGFMTAKPPLESLAFTNLEHWLVSSDAANHLAWAMIAFYVAAGFRQDEVDQLKADGLNWGSIARAVNEKATLGMVEHSGEAITAGERRLEKLEQQMEVLGLAPFVERRSEATATGVSSADSGTTSMLQEWVADESQTITDAVKLAAKLTKQTLHKDFRVRIYRDFVVPVGAASEAPTILLAQAQGVIDKLQAAKELQRRGTISDEVDIEAMLERAKKEAVPAASTKGLDDPDDDDPDPDAPPKDKSKPPFPPKK